jgi:hypothetical protein
VLRKTGLVGLFARVDLNNCSAKREITGSYTRIGKEVLVYN